MSGLTEEVEGKQEYGNALSKKFGKMFFFKKKIFTLKTMSYTFSR
jgi:hypothetical protein